MNCIHCGHKIGLIIQDFYIILRLINKVSKLVIKESGFSDLNPFANSAVFIESFHFRKINHLSKYSSRYKEGFLCWNCNIFYPTNRPLNKKSFKDEYKINNRKSNNENKKFLPKRLKTNHSKNVSR